LTVGLVVLGVLIFVAGVIIGQRAGLSSGKRFAAHEAEMRGNAAMAERLLMRHVCDETCNDGCDHRLQIDAILAVVRRETAPSASTLGKSAQ